MSRKIPPQRLRVLQFIKPERAARRPFPSLAAIRAHMGWKHRASALDALINLALLDEAIWHLREGKRWTFGYAPFADPCVP